jgi:hypothetical protein
MAVKVVDFRRDLPGLRKYVAARVAKQSKVRKPISAIAFGFQLCQAGWSSCILTFGRSTVATGSGRGR